MNSLIGNDTLPDHERLVPCPYNKAHLVVQHRMANHLVKCRKSSGITGTKECRFNSSHILPISEAKQHEATCPDRLIIDSFIQQRNSCPPEINVLPASGPSIKSTDDWDAFEDEGEYKA